MTILIKITSISGVKTNVWNGTTYFNMTIEGHSDVTGGDYLFSVSGDKFCYRVTNTLKAGMCITAEYSCEVRRSKSEFAWQVLKLTNFTIGAPSGATAPATPTGGAKNFPPGANPFEKKAPQNGGGIEETENDDEGIDLNDL